MKKELLRQGCIKLFGGLIFISLLLFLPAGTFRYWNAWLFLGILFVPMLIAGAVLLQKSPALLAKRLKTHETVPEQRQVIGWSIVMFLAGFITAGLDFRFGWSRLSMEFVLVMAAVQVVCYGLYIEVMRENAYLSRTVEVQEHQMVVDTGLYGVIRHPMYFATVLLFWAMPLVLGSIWAFLVFLPYPLLLVKRIRSEETILESGLPGYTEYKQRVKYRLFPFIW